MCERGERLYVQLQSGLWQAVQKMCPAGSYFQPRPSEMQKL